MIVLIDEFVVEVLVKGTAKILTPFFDVRDKNIKARITGVDPLQKPYLKK